MIAFHQALVAAAPGDAITSSALEIRDLLRRIGPSDVFAWYIDPALDGVVIPMQVYQEWTADREHEAILFYHASIGEPDVLSFLIERPEPLILVYRNISPAAPFLPYDPEFAGVLEEGRRELLELKDRFIVSFADSEFNAQELRDLGFRRVKVVPPILDLSSLTDLTPDESVTRSLQSSGPVVLYVGQLLPHKRPDLLIQIHHILSTYLMPDVQTVLVGPTRLHSYKRTLESFVSDLNLSGLHLAGRVPRASLVAYYQSADVFITMSEHEGFCVPLVEAMSFDTPVVARNMTAIPETLGGAGILIPDESPTLAAEALAALLMDSELHSQLVTAGKRRLQDFDPDAARTRFLNQLLEFV